MKESKLQIADETFLRLSGNCLINLRDITKVYLTPAIASSKTDALFRRPVVSVSLAGSLEQFEEGTPEFDVLAEVFGLKLLGQQGSTTDEGR